MTGNNDLIFRQAVRTADILVEMLGAHCEVAVHDFRNLEESLIYVAGTITGRSIGGPITDLVLQELKKPSDEIMDIPNYRTVSKNGHVMKSSTVFLRDLEDEIIGALCINIDISLLIQLGAEINDFLSIAEEEKSSENFYTSVQDVVEDMVRQVLQSFNKAPTLLEMDEKIECVRILEEKGAFLIKGSTEYLASMMGVSKYTIYNYLQKIRVDTTFGV
ncbi:DNA-binding protein [Pullulanibacillus camelliae]|uniref:DNA-binding protein n=1 Tax=Pullulanibacillus camelliae TaxID=1707096 RepID=A0A8J2VD40_9BACL|nr:PAS domain-containing protein [Pullulanibacillus camelliae]GGE27055.1 DNA-binding protein [Pullulanibacillus camelliae]